MPIYLLCFYDFMHCNCNCSVFKRISGQLSASLVSLLFVILVVFGSVFLYCRLCFVTEIKLSYLNYLILMRTKALVYE